MRSRYVPYAATPVRVLLQFVSDVIAIAWTMLWVVIGLAVHDAISTIAEVGRQVEEGANGIAGNLDSAGNGARDVPLIGDDLSKPLTAAGDAARDIAGAGHSLDTTATWLAVVLAIAVAAPPILAVAGPWLWARLRFWRRKWIVAGLAETPTGQQLLALRALANRPLRRLVAVNADPVGAWRREDPIAIGGLAALEMRGAGISPRR